MGGPAQDRGSWSSTDGRLREISTVKRTLSQGPGGLLVSGPPGYGKTTFAQALGDELSQRGWLIAHAQLRMAASAGSFVTELAGALFAGILAPADGSWASVVGAVGGLSARPNLQITGDGQIRFNYPALTSAQLRTSVHELLALSDRAADDAGRPCLLILDELTEARALLPDLDDVLLAALPRMRRLRIIGLGIGPALQATRVGTRHPTCRHWGDPIPLPPFNAEMIRRHLAEVVSERGLVATPGALAALSQRLDGHPRALEIVRRHLLGPWMPGAPRIGRAAVEGAWEAALATEAGHHMTIWRSLPPQKKAVLVALSAEGESPYSRRYREKHQLGSVSVVQKALLALSHTGFVWQRDSRHWTVIDPLFRCFLRRSAGYPSPHGNGIRCG